MKLQVPLTNACTSVVKRFFLSSSNRCGGGGGLLIPSTINKFMSMSIQPLLYHYSRTLMSTPSQSAVLVENSVNPASLQIHKSWMLESDRTAGQIWHYLQREKMGKNKDISILEWTRLVSVSKPNTPSDARLIRTALMELNRHSIHFKLNRDMAKDTILGMMRSMTPPLVEGDEPPTIQTLKQHLEAVLFVGEAILNKPTGLYVAVETSVVDVNVLQHGWNSLQRIMGQSLEDVDDESRVLLQEIQTLLYPRMLPVITGLVQLLWERCSKPMRKMKKRAARKYKKKLACTQGPSPQTIDWAVKLCLEIGKKGNDTVPTMTTTTSPSLDNSLDVAIQMVRELESRRWLGIPLEETKQSIAQIQNIQG